MKRFVPVALGLAAFLALILWLLREPSATVPEGPRTDAQTADLSEKLRARLAEGPPREELEAQGSLELHGRVLGTDGEPVGGALVTVTARTAETPLSQLPCGCADQCSDHVLDGSCPEAPQQILEKVAERYGEAKVLARTTSAADGSFVLRGLEPAPYRVWADSERGIATAEIQGDQKTFELTLDKGWLLTGKVVESDVGPLAGAVVNALDAEHGRYYDVLTASDGTFSIGPVISKRHLVVASFGVMIPNAERMGPEDDLEHRTLVLSKPERLTGKVVRNDAPVPNAPVTLSGMHRADTVRSDVNGAFAFERLRPGRYSVVASEGGDTAAGSAMAGGKKASEPLVLRLERGGVLVGRVLDGDGNPIPDAEISASTEAPGADPTRETVTDAEGAFRIDPIAAGQVTVRATAKGFLTQSGRAEVLVTANQEAHTELVLDRGAEVAGVVVDPTGAPVKDAKVIVFAEDRGADDATTGDDGSFKVRISPGPAKVKAEHDEFFEQLTEVTAPSASLRIVMERGLVLRGRVVDEKGGTPSGQMRVFAVAPGRGAGGGDEDFERPGKVLDDGHFVLKGLLSGELVVMAMAEEGEADARTMRLGAKKVSLPYEGTLLVPLQSGQSIRGMVVDQHGKPAGKLRILAKLEGLDEKTPAVDQILTLLEGGAPFSHTVSGEDGRFELKNVRPGRYELSVSSAEHEPLEAKANAGDSSVRLVVKRLPRISGRVVGDDGRPLTRFSVNEQTREDPEGRFTFSPRGRTKLELVVRAPEYAPSSRSIQLTGGDVDVGEVRLTRGAVISGRVVDRATGAPVVGALVDVKPVPASSNWTLSVEQGAVRTGADGRFQRKNSDVSPATQLLVWHADYVKTSQPISSAAQELTVELGKTAIIRGRLVLSDGRFDHGIVRALKDGESVAWSRVDTQGAFELRGLAGGSYRLVALTDRPFAAVDITVADGAVETVELRERAGGSEVRIRVEGIPERFTGALLPGEVALAPALDRAMGQIQSGIAAASREDAELKFLSVPAGAYTLVIVSFERDRVRGSTHRISVAGAGAERQAVRFPADARVLSERDE